MSREPRRRRCVVVWWFGIAAGFDSVQADGVREARKIQFDWKDTDDELENDDATQATQSAQDHEAQLITTATTSTTTTRTRPQRKASDAAVMSSRARTLSTDSVEMPPSTNPDNKKGRGKGRAKGAK